MRGVRRDFATPPSSPERMNPATCLPYIYFALFDGHAGIGAAVAAANQLHHILHVSTYHKTLSFTLREEHGLRVSENRVLRRIFEPGMKWQEAGEDCIMRSFVTCTLCHILVE
jgi:hypothetical protein